MKPEDIKKALKSALNQIQEGRKAGISAQKLDDPSSRNAALKEAQSIISLGFSNLRDSIEGLVKNNSRKMAAPFDEILNFDDATRIEALIDKTYAQTPSSADVRYGILEEKHERASFSIMLLSFISEAYAVPLSEGGIINIKDDRVKSVINYAARTIVPDSATGHTRSNAASQLRHLEEFIKHTDIQEEVDIAVAQQCEQFGLKIPGGPEKFVKDIRNNLSKGGN